MMYFVFLLLGTAVTCITQSFVCSHLLTSNQFIIVVEMEFHLRRPKRC